MAMRNEENVLDEQIELSPERACEILKNVFRACKMEPPSDCEKYFYKQDIVSYLGNRQFIIIKLV